MKHSAVLIAVLTAGIATCGGAARAETIAFGAASGAPAVKLMDAATLRPTAYFNAYDPAARSGVRIGFGDVDGDGKADLVTGAGAQQEPRAKLFSGGSTLTRSWLAYEATFAGGISVAAADVNGDGRADILTGAGAGGGPHVKLFDGATGTMIASFFAFDPQFRGGVRVALGDVTGDGRADIVVGTETQTPRVRAFDGRTLKLVADFLPFGASTAGGVSLAVGRFGRLGALFVGAGAGAPARVNVYNPGDFRLVASRVPFATSYLGGVNLAAGTFRGRDALIVAAASQAGDVLVLDTAGGTLTATLAGLQPFGTDHKGGVVVATAAPAPRFSPLPLGRR